MTKVNKIIIKKIIRSIAFLKTSPLKVKNIKLKKARKIQCGWLSIKLVPNDTNGNNAAIKKNLAIIFVKLDSIVLLSIFKEGLKIIKLSINIKAQI